jgi:hypothetical protein
MPAEAKERSQSSGAETENSVKPLQNWGVLGERTATAECKRPVAVSSQVVFLQTVT